MEYQTFIEVSCMYALSVKKTQWKVTNFLVVTYIFPQTIILRN